MATKSGSAKAKKASISKKAAKKAAGTSAPLNFTKAVVVPGIVPKTYFLIVSGTKPYLNMTVELRPLIYVRRPEYWGIEVIGTLSGIGLPVKSPYHEFIPLQGILGTKGIEVIGATKKKKIKVP